MNRVDFLEAIKDFTENATKEMKLPVRFQKGDVSSNAVKSADVYLMRLSGANSATKKAPYILQQIVSADDTQKSGQKTISMVHLRTVFCIYCEDEGEGALYLLGLMERLRIALLKKRVVADKYYLDLNFPLESIIYTEDTAPYYIGEFSSNWKMPSIERETIL